MHVTSSSSTVAHTDSSTTLQLLALILDLNMFRAEASVVFPGDGFQKTCAKPRPWNLYNSWPRSSQNSWSKTLITIDVKNVQVTWACFQRPSSAHLTKFKLPEGCVLMRMLHAELRGGFAYRRLKRLVPFWKCLIRTTPPCETQSKTFLMNQHTQLSKLPNLHQRAISTKKSIFYESVTFKSHEFMMLPHSWLGALVSGFPASWCKPWRKKYPRLTSNADKCNSATIEN